jgi:hypothetical protein
VGCEGDHSHQFTAQVQKMWNYTSTPYTSSAWDTKHTDNFTTLPYPSPCKTVNRPIHYVKNVHTYWIQLAWDRDKWQALVSAVMNLRFP